jgi:hypothetical protein
MTFEITVSSPEAYLAILEVLVSAVEDGKLDFEFSLPGARRACAKTRATCCALRYLLQGDKEKREQDQE